MTGVEGMSRAPLAVVFPSCALALTGGGCWVRRRVPPAPGATRRLLRYLLPAPARRRCGNQTSGTRAGRAISRSPHPGHGADVLPRGRSEPWPGREALLTHRPREAWSCLSPVSCLPF